ncbi:MAG: glutathione S-transferase C-terminal domain-containing protein [Proteobacteria bacterium]|nr:glutathione S-transferase C-terminal domain-containing protein [Pseudomonadota bacterium]
MSGMLRVFGSRISYYTGKLETYLRFRSLDYELLPTIGNERRLREGAGAVQMPVVQLADGRWMSDSTPILAWLDAQQAGPSIYPEDPALRFIALLLEDYADEWLWRPAMHYRWSYRQDREHASGLLADELTGHIPLPRVVKRLLIARRQLRGFVRGDGVDETTRRHVERSALEAFARLEAVFAERRFVLGGTATIADFGFMGPMLRHFGQDPTPSELMRNRAPGVYAWVGRMWNHRAGHTPALLPAVDAPLSGLLAEVCATHLVQLRENAAAYARGLGRYDQEIQGCRYRRVPTSRYRVWCLEQLRRAWQALDATARDALRPHLPEPEAAVLWDATAAVDSGYDPEGRAPFNRAINVFGRGVPR